MYILFGLIGGIFGGMGMGGGTLLIPLLTIFLNVPQHIAQGINLLSFVPMAIITIIIHAKNKLINFKNILYIIIPALLCGGLLAFFSAYISGGVLKKCFGGFLVLLAIWQLLLEIKKSKRG